MATCLASSAPALQRLQPAILAAPPTACRRAPSLQSSPALLSSARAVFCRRTSGSRKPATRPLLTNPPRESSAFLCRVSADEPQEDGGVPEAASEETDLTEKLLSFGIFAFWAAWLAYGTLLAPNQTPSIDKYYIEKLVGLRANDGFIINAVVFSLWNIMGVLPLLYATLLIPGSRTNRTKLPAWPFVSVSFFLGAFALLPYFALWNSGDASIPTQEERQKLPFRIFESKITAVALLVAASGLLYNAISAPSADWIEFDQILRQSRLFHVTSSDFAVLAMSAPFWTYNDMSYRNWAPRDSWGLGLLCLPVIGPLIYVLLRPGLPPPASSDEK